MQISEEELKRRLNSSKNILNTPASPVKVREIPKREQAPPVSKSTRVMAGVLHGTGESAKSVAHGLGMSVSQVRDARALPEARVGIERVRDLALDKLMLTLGLMTEDKFLNSNLKDLSIVAANMSRIIEKTSPREGGATLQLIVYTPELKRESQYKVIDV